VLPTSRLLEPLRAALLPGDGLVGRWPGVLVVAHCQDETTLRWLLDLCASASASADRDGPGRALARRLAQWLGAPDGPGDQLTVGTLSVAGDRLAVFLSGSVALSIAEQDLVLSGEDAATWADRFVPFPSGPVELALGGAHGPVGPASALHDLRAGVVPAAGVVLRSEPDDAAMPDPPSTPGRTPSASGWAQGRDGGRDGATAERAASGEAVRNGGSSARAVPPVRPAGSGPWAAWRALRDEGPAPRERAGGAGEASARLFDDPLPGRGAGARGYDDHHRAPEPQGHPRDGAGHGGGEGRFRDHGADRPPDGEHMTEVLGARPAARPDDRGDEAAYGRDARRTPGADRDTPGDGADHGRDDARDRVHHLGRGTVPGIDSATDPASERADRDGGSARRAVAADERAAAARADAPDLPEWFRDADGGAERAPRPAEGWGLFPAVEPGEAGPDRPRGAAPRPRPFVSTTLSGPAGEDLWSPAPEPAAAEADDARNPRTDPTGTPAVAPSPLDSPWSDPVPAQAADDEEPAAADESARTTGLAPVTVLHPQGRPRHAGSWAGHEPPAAGEQEPAEDARDEGAPRAVEVLEGELVPFDDDDPDDERDEAPAVPGRLVFDDGASYALDGEYLVGRLPEADARVRSGALRSIVLDDRSGAVSRVHAEVRVDGDDVLVVDSGSRNGTFVAGPGEDDRTAVPAQERRVLSPGSRVRVGGRTFTFVG
jgi:hypothetical protein